MAGLSILSATVFDDPGFSVDRFQSLLGWHEAIAIKSNSSSLQLDPTSAISMLNIDEASKQQLGSAVEHIKAAYSAHLDKARTLNISILFPVTF